MEMFENNDYKFISDFVESKLSILRNNEEFNKKTKILSDSMEELEKTLSKEQKEKFDKIIKLFYDTEEYYFAFSYSLGVKYGEDLRNL